MKTVVACEFCNGDFSVEYQDTDSHVTARKAVLAHEQQCLANPLVRRIAELEQGVQLILDYRYSIEHPMGVAVQLSGSHLIFATLIDEAFPEEEASSEKRAAKNSKLKTHDLKLPSPSPEVSP